MAIVFTVLSEGMTKLVQHTLCPFNGAGDKRSLPNLEQATTELKRNRSEPQDCHGKLHVVVPRVQPQ